MSKTRAYFKISIIKAYFILEYNHTIKNQSVRTCQKFDISLQIFLIKIFSMSFKTFICILLYVSID